MKKITLIVLMLITGSVAVAATVGAYSGGEPSVERQKQFQLAEDLVAVVGKASGTNRIALLTDARKTVENLCWIQDDIFGNALVLQARLSFIDGKTNDALRLLDAYKPQLNQITKAMLARGEQTNDTPSHGAAMLRKDIGNVSTQQKDLNSQPSARGDGIPPPQP